MKSFLYSLHLNEQTMDNEFRVTLKFTYISFCASEFLLFFFAWKTTTIKKKKIICIRNVLLRTGEKSFLFPFLYQIQPNIEMEQKVAVRTVRSSVFIWDFVRVVSCFDFRLKCKVLSYSLPSQPFPPTRLLQHIKKSFICSKIWKKINFQSSKILLIIIRRESHCFRSFHWYYKC